MIDQFEVIVDELIELETPIQHGMLAIEVMRPILEKHGVTLVDDDEPIAPLNRELPPLVTFNRFGEKRAHSGKAR